MKTFQLQPAAAAAHISALAQLSSAQAPAKGSSGAMGGWCAAIMGAAEGVLSQYVETGGEGRPVEETEMRRPDWKAVTAVFTVGQVRVAETGMKFVWPECGMQ